MPLWDSQVHFTARINGDGSVASEMEPSPPLEILSLLLGSCSQSGACGGENCKVGKDEKVLPTPPLPADYIQAVMGKLISPQEP